jgi:hypothetical protein
MTRNVDVMEEKMNLVTKFYFYFYLDGQCWECCKKKFKAYAIFLASKFLKFGLQTRSKV